MSQLEFKESPLGRGLSDLFGNTQQDTSVRDEFQYIQIDLLRPGKFQPRCDFDPEASQHLTESIRAQGILQPILVRQIEFDPPRYEIIAGERRWQAAKQAGLIKVPVYIRSTNDQEALEIAIIENIQRQDLNLIEEGQAYKRLIDEFRYTHDQVARVIHKSRSYITNAIRLLSLPEKIQEAVRKNLITASHARTLINMENAEELAQKIEQNQINVRQTEALKKKKNTSASQDNFDQAEEKNSDLQIIKDQLTQALQMPLTITYAKKKGELKIKFKTLEQLDQLVERLTQQKKKEPFIPRIYSV